MCKIYNKLSYCNSKKSNKKVNIFRITHLQTDGEMCAFNVQKKITLYAREYILCIFIYMYVCVYACLYFVVGEKSKNERLWQVVGIR